MNVYSSTYIVPAMREIVPDRLREAMERARVNQSQLATAVGLKQPSIGRILTGETKTSRVLDAIAQRLKTTPAFLCGDTDEPGVSGASDVTVPFKHFPGSTPQEISTIADFAEEMGLIGIEEVDLALGMGASFLDDVDVKYTMRWIPADWVRQFTDAPASNLSIARPVGDSMYPTINDRDIIIIDRSLRHIDRQEGIWALVYGGLGTVKRVRVMPDGSLKLMADNKAVGDEIAYDGEAFVIGRVAGLIKRT